MYLTRTEYDRGVNTFSPEGRLFQVEYAIEAIKLGTSAIGIKTPTGVILAVEKRLTSPLLEPSCIEKIVEIDSHIAAAHSGLAADARTLVERARIQAQNHRFTYDEPIKTRSLTQGVCDLCLMFSEDTKEKLMSRPFGVAFLFAGMDKDGVQLYHTDPSGTFIEYKAKVIGAGEQAQLTLEEQYRSDMTMKEAEDMSVEVLKGVMEDKIKSTNIEIATVTADRGYYVYSKDEVIAILERMED
jgi:20S proteasome subunit alpha 5